MPNPSKTILAFPAATLTTTTQGSKIVAVESYTSFIAVLTCGTVSGTSPTLNAIIQQGMRVDKAGDVDGGNVTGTDANIVWNDYAAFTQVTSSNANIWMNVVGGGGTAGAAALVGAAKNGTLSAGTILGGPIGAMWRINAVIAGTSPSFASVKVIIQFIP